MLTARGWELLSAVAAVRVAVWFWMAIYRPVGPCRWCRGRSRAGSRARWRNLDCSHCGNSGQRTTWGARLVRGGRGWGK